jgi:predicted AAA+ superfamily ATPase
VREQGARFENLVASHLLKWVEYQVDVEGRPMELRYFRDHDGREVDFVIVEHGKPVSFIECKAGDAPVSPALKYLQARVPGVASWQISARGTRDYVTTEGIRVAPAARCLAELV